MNTPTQTTANGVNQQVISSARCALLYCTVVNTSGATRVYALYDQSSAPPLRPGGAGQGIISPPIVPGATWRVFPIDASLGSAFTLGCVLQSFGVDASNNPMFTALSSADANLVAWSAPLQ
jgi:hypothetical protein